MRQLHKLLYLLSIVCITTTAGAQNFQVLDINKARDANPTNNTLFDGYDWGHADTYYAVYNGVAYFSADDGIHGAELWRSDGTDRGTYMVKDINQGIGSSNVRDITISGGKIYFSATDGVNSQGIWITDGTAQGTRQIADISGYSSSNPTYLTDANGILYFFTDENLGYYTEQAAQLWKTDGTASGTVLVADFNSPDFNYGSQGRQITNVNGRVFFSLLNYGYDDELYTSDGTTAGTIWLNNIDPSGNGSNPSYLTSFKGLLYFSASNGNGTNLWVSDGTPGGTHQINNANNIYTDDDPYFHFSTINNALYFTGYSPDGDGTELCKYDVSDAANNVEVVKDFNPGTYSDNLYNITNVNGTLFFTVYNGKDQTLWKSDGTTKGTVQLKDINPGGHNIYLFRHFVNANGTLLFSFYDDEQGYELWKSNGTTAGTAIVRDINPGIYGSQVTNITYVGKNVSLFEAYDGKTGLELWKTDGNAAGTSLVKLINQSSTSSSSPVWLTREKDGRHLIFSAYDPNYGHEMRITDGSASGTHVIKDIYKGTNDSWPYLPTNFKNATYFFANIDDPIPHYSSDIFLVSRFWQTDGTEKGTTMISVPALETLINQFGYVVSTISTSDFLYLLLFNFNSYQYELWRSDGTGPGTYAIKTDIGSYYTPVLTVVGAKLFFTDYDAVTGYGLWVTGGFASNTSYVPNTNTAYPQNFCAFKGKLYFTGYDALYNSYLWACDAAINSAEILNTQVTTYGPLASTNEKLFFQGYTPDSGSELWGTDGTAKGTKLVKDIYPGLIPYSSYANSSYPGSFTSTGSELFFLASDSAHGQELWKSDGTFRGTQLVKDITPGVYGTYLYDMVSAGGKLFFLNNDALWTSDGTSFGTAMVNDYNLVGVYGLANLTSFGNQICLIAGSNATGQEIWVGSIKNCGPQLDDLAIGTPEIYRTGDGSAATIYPNPVSNTLNVKMAPSGSGKVSFLIMDITGKPLGFHTALQGGSQTAIDVSNLPSGTYILKIIPGDGKVTTIMKFVKM